MNAVRIMVIDDEAVVREGVRRTLVASGFTVEACASGQQALARLLDDSFSLVITDLRMPGMSGMEVLSTLHALRPGLPVIMITGYAMVESAVEAMKHGAVDYIAKPFKPQDIVEKVQAALDSSCVSPDDAYLHKNIKELKGFGLFVGESLEMEKVYRRIVQVAPTDSTVLVTGESGTGKELVARAIHEHSKRRSGPFVAVDCTSLAENLLESELFGHVKGSFTGAMHTKAGLFKVADGGTLFLDEVANISLTTQAKLLRVLQQREVTPIGGTAPIAINIRLVAASNRDLREMVQDGSFREDLFFRLNIIPIELPPLRNRKGDLPLLVRHFVSNFAEEIGKEIRGVAPDALAALERYPFPGNVRELENIIQRAVVLAQGELIRGEELELQNQVWGQPAAADHIPLNVDELKESKRLLREQAIEPLEKAFVLKALERNDWNISRAAEETGMQRSNFQAMMKKLGVTAHGC